MIKDKKDIFYLMLHPQAGASRERYTSPSLFLIQSLYN